MSSGRGVRIAKKAGLVFAGLLVALLIGECAARIFLPPPPNVAVVTTEQRSFEVENMELNYVPESGGLYIGSRSGLRLRPNTRAVLRRERLSRKTIEIRTNSLGYRGPEVIEREGARILFLGDSITFANYLPESETFVNRVGEMAKLEGRTWNAINAGVGTISLGNELAILKETGLSIDPDVVVVMFYLNDFEESPGVAPINSPRWLRWSRLAHYTAQLFARRRHRTRDARKAARDALNAEIKAELEGRLEVKPGNWRRDQAALNKLIVDKSNDWGGAWSEKAWQIMRPLFVELKRLSEIHEFKLVFIATPVRYQAEAEFLDDFPQRKLAAIAKDLDVPMLDLLPAHREAVKNRIRLFYDHCHHTPDGAKIAAGAITEFLLEVIEP